MEKCDFWDVEKFCFSSQKKFVFYLGHHSTLFLVLFWLKTTNEKKNPFFDQKHGLTPLEKCHFWDIEKLLFLLSKKVSFLFRTLYKPYFMFFSDWKQIKKKIACFDQNYGLIPFRKMPFWDFENFVFIVKNVFFLSQTLFSIISSLILTKNMVKNMRFLRLWKILFL